MYPRAASAASPKPGMIAICVQRTTGEMRTDEEE